MREDHHDEKYSTKNLIGESGKLHFPSDTLQYGRNSQDINLVRMKMVEVKKVEEAKSYLFSMPTWGDLYNYSPEADTLPLASNNLLSQNLAAAVASTFPLSLNASEAVAAFIAAADESDTDDEIL